MVVPDNQVNLWAAAPARIYGSSPTIGVMQSGTFMTARPAQKDIGITMQVTDVRDVPTDALRANGEPQSSGTSGDAVLLVERPGFFSVAFDLISEGPTSHAEDVPEKKAIVMGTVITTNDGNNSVASHYFTVQESQVRTSDRMSEVFNHGLITIGLSESAMQPDYSIKCLWRPRDAIQTIWELQGTVDPIKGSVDLMKRVINETALDEVFDATVVQKDTDLEPSMIMRAQELDAFDSTPHLLVNGNINEAVCVKGDPGDDQVYGFGGLKAKIMYMPDHENGPFVANIEANVTNEHGVEEPRTQSNLSCTAKFPKYEQEVVISRFVVKPGVSHGHTLEMVGSGKVEAVSTMTVSHNRAKLKDVVFRVQESKLTTANVDLEATQQIMIQNKPTSYQGAKKTIQKSEAGDDAQELLVDAAAFEAVYGPAVRDVKTEFNKVAFDGLIKEVSFKIDRIEAEQGTNFTKACRMAERHEANWRGVVDKDGQPISIRAGNPFQAQSAVLVRNPDGKAGVTLDSLISFDGRESYYLAADQVIRIGVKQISHRPDGQRAAHAAAASHPHFMSLENELVEKTEYVQKSVDEYTAAAAALDKANDAKEQISHLESVKEDLLAQRLIKIKDRRARENERDDLDQEVVDITDRIAQLNAKKHKLENETIVDLTEALSAAQEDVIKAKADKEATIAALNARQKAVEHAEAIVTAKTDDESSKKTKLDGHIASLGKLAEDIKNWRSLGNVDAAQSLEKVLMSEVAEKDAAEKSYQDAMHARMQAEADAHARDQEYQAALDQPNVAEQVLQSFKASRDLAKQKLDNATNELELATEQVHNLERNKVKQEEMIDVLAATIADIQTHVALVDEDIASTEAKLRVEQLALEVNVSYSALAYQAFSEKQLSIVKTELQKQRAQIANDLAEQEERLDIVKQKLSSKKVKLVKVKADIQTIADFENEVARAELLLTEVADTTSPFVRSFKAFLVKLNAEWLKIKKVDIPLIVGEIKVTTVALNAANALAQRLSGELERIIAELKSLETAKAAAQLIDSKRLEIDAKLKEIDDTQKTIATVGRKLTRLEERKDEETAKGVTVAELLVSSTNRLEKLKKKKAKKLKKIERAKKAKEAFEAALSEDSLRDNTVQDYPASFGSRVCESANEQIKRFMLYLQKYMTENADSLDTLYNTNDDSIYKGYWPIGKNGESLKADVNSGKISAAKYNKILESVHPSLAKGFGLFAASIKPEEFVMYKNYKTFSTSLFERDVNLHRQSARGDSNVQWQKSVTSMFLTIVSMPDVQGNFGGVKDATNRASEATKPWSERLIVTEPADAEMVAGIWKSAMQNIGNESNEYLDLWTNQFGLWSNAYNMSTGITPDSFPDVGIEFIEESYGIDDTIPTVAEQYQNPNAPAIMKSAQNRFLQRKQLFRMDIDVKKKRNPNKGSYKKTLVENGFRTLFMGPGKAGEKTGVKKLYIKTDVVPKVVQSFDFAPSQEESFEVSLAEFNNLVNSNVSEDANVYTKPNHKALAKWFNAYTTVNMDTAFGTERVGLQASSVMTVRAKEDNRALVPSPVVALLDIVDTFAFYAELDSTRYAALVEDLKNAQAEHSDLVEETELRMIQEEYAEVSDAYYNTPDSGPAAAGSLLKRHEDRQNQEDQLEIALTVLENTVQEKRKQLYAMFELFDEQFSFEKLGSATDLMSDPELELEETSYSSDDIRDFVIDLTNEKRKLYFGRAVRAAALAGAQSLIHNISARIQKLHTQLEDKNDRSDQISDIIDFIYSLDATMGQDGSETGLDTLKGIRDSRWWWKPSTWRADTRDALYEIMGKRKMQFQNNKGETVEGSFKDFAALWESHNMGKVDYPNWLTSSVSDEPDEAFAEYVASLGSAEDLQKKLQDLQGKVKALKERRDAAEKHALELEEQLQSKQDERARVNKELQALKLARELASDEEVVNATKRLEEVTLQFKAAAEASQVVQTELRNAIKKKADLTKQLVAANAVVAAYETGGSAAEGLDQIDVLLGGTGLSADLKAQYKDAKKALEDAEEKAKKQAEAITRKVENAGENVDAVKRAKQAGQEEFVLLAKGVKEAVANLKAEERRLLSTLKESFVSDQASLLVEEKNKHRLQQQLVDAKLRLKAEESALVQAKQAIVSARDARNAANEDVISARNDLDAANETLKTSTEADLLDVLNHSQVIKHVKDAVTQLSHRKAQLVQAERELAVAIQGEDIQKDHVASAMSDVATLRSHIKANSEVRRELHEAMVNVSAIFAVLSNAYTSKYGVDESALPVAAVCAFNTNNKGRDKHEHVTIMRTSNDTGIDKRKFEKHLVLFFLDADGKTVLGRPTGYSYGEAKSIGLVAETVGRDKNGEETDYYSIFLSDAHGNNFEELSQGKKDRFNDVVTAGKTHPLPDADRSFIILVAWASGKEKGVEQCSVIDAVAVGNDTDDVRVDLAGLLEDSGKDVTGSLSNKIVFLNKDSFFDASPAPYDVNSETEKPGDVGFVIAKFKKASAPELWKLGRRSPFRHRQWLTVSNAAGSSSEQFVVEDWFIAAYKALPSQRGPYSLPGEAYKVNNLLSIRTPRTLTWTVTPGGLYNNSPTEFITEASNMPAELYMRFYETLYQTAAQSSENVSFELIYGPDLRFIMDKVLSVRREFWLTSYPKLQTKDTKVLVDLDGNAFVDGEANEYQGSSSVQAWITRNLEIELQLGGLIRKLQGMFSQRTLTLNAIALYADPQGARWQGVENSALESRLTEAGVTELPAAVLYDLEDSIDESDSM